GDCADDDPRQDAHDVGASLGRLPDRTAHSRLRWDGERRTSSRSTRSDALPEASTVSRKSQFPAPAARLAQFPHRDGIARSDPQNGASRARCSSLPGVKALPEEIETSALIDCLADAWGFDV